MLATLALAGCAGPFSGPGPDGEDAARPKAAPMRFVGSSWRMLSEVDPADRQLGDLMTQGGRVPTGQGPATAATGRRLARDRFTHQVGGRHRREPASSLRIS